MSMRNNVNTEIIEMKKIISPVIAMRNDEPDEDLILLIDSIKKIGLLNPITVNRIGESYEIIAGFRRYCAFKVMKEDYIPAFVWERDLENVLYARMAENMDRKEVSIIEEAMYLDSIKIAMKLKNKELAKFVKRSEAYVSERLSIISYHPELMAALKDGHISFSVAREFNRVKDKTQLYYFLRYAIKGGCSPSQAHEWVQDYIKSTKDDGVQYIPPEPDESNPEIQQPVFKYPCHVCEGSFIPTDLRPYQICSQCRIELEL